MKKLMMFAAFAALPALAGAETWTNAAMVDVSCSAKAKADPDAHTRACALGCAKSGFGILTSDGSFLKFDQKGNDETLAALKKTNKKDHLRVTVNGERSGDTIHVQSVKL
ncbi:MAG TPA: hypothetical protein VHD76_14125 [Bryobacteraceae bacterium]|mgnify:CR=1 FL=1|jgi:hypothetical protein|nr:hypothetical protein [Bryobacteraceae bacterium]